MKRLTSVITGPITGFDEKPSSGRNCTRGPGASMSNPCTTDGAVVSSAGGVGSSTSERSSAYAPAARSFATRSFSSSTSRSTSTVFSCSGAIVHLGDRHGLEVAGGIAPEEELGPLRACGPPVVRADEEVLAEIALALSYQRNEPAPVSLIEM